LAETQKTCYITSYGWDDNDPPGDGIANPIVHQKAGGTGTFADPITIAVCSAQVPYGTRMYVPGLRRYFVAEDYCQASWDDYNRGVAKLRIDVWAGRATAAYESSITGDYLVIFDPSPNYAVNPGVLYDTRQTNQGNTIVMSSGTQPCPGTVLVVPSEGYSWNTNGNSAAISYPNSYNRPNGTNTATGVGTWNDPVTCAVSADLAAQIPVGSKFYVDTVKLADGSFASIKRYCVYEDLTQDPNKVIFWVGGATASGGRDAVTNAALAKGEAWVTGQATLIINPGLGSTCPVPNATKIANDPNVGTSTGGGTPPPPPPGSRDRTLWPFSIDSHWNRPLGSGATYAPTSDARVQYLSRSHIYVNSGEWSDPVFQAGPSDPLYTLHETESNRNRQIRVPGNARPDPTTDPGMSVIDETKTFVTDMYGANFSGSTITSERAWKYTLSGEGRRADDATPSMDPAANFCGSALGGLIRLWELQGANQIRHALIFSTGDAGLKHTTSFPYPAVQEDYDGSSTYHGTMVAGTMIAVAPTVDLNTLGLSTNGLKVAKALQDYGAYLSNRSADNQITLYAEGAAEGPLVDDIRNTIDRVRPYLRVVTNASTPGNPTGGGTPRAPSAPALA
jgi:3D (Asp-Asp-Asp) domain-containing protein